MFQYEALKRPYKICHDMPSSSLGKLAVGNGIRDTHTVDTLMCAACAEEHT